MAAVLRCLRTLYAPDLPRQALEEIGLAVGSDVPFCVRGGTCLAEGRGELLTDLPPLPDCAIVLCKPDFGLPTPELFARLDLSLIHICTPPQNIQSQVDLGRGLQRQSLHRTTSRGPPPAVWVQYSTSLPK